MVPTCYVSIGSTIKLCSGAPDHSGSSSPALKRPVELCHHAPVWGTHTSPVTTLSSTWRSSNACDLATQVVSHLLKLIGSEDENVQEAAADCLQNIR